MEDPMPAVPGAPSHQRHRRRLRASEVRQQMLEAGRIRALETGVGVSLEDISMEEIIQLARVPRSSVYRLWPYKSDYAADLLIYLAGPAGYLGGHQVFDPATYDVARKTMAEHGHRLDSREDRRAVLCEVVRLAVTRNFQHLLDDQQWRVHLAMLATLGSIRDSQARAAVAAALEVGEARARQNMAALIEEIMATIGLRLRSPHATIEHLVVAGVSILQNLALRHALTADAVGLTTPDPENPGKLTGDLIREHLPGPAGLDGQPTRWSLPALTYLGLVDSFVEPDPAFRPISH
jgi:AcrR family transcriptional regulator